MAAVQWQLLCELRRAIVAGSGIQAAWKALLMSSWLLLGRSLDNAEDATSATQKLEERLFLFQMGQCQELILMVLADTRVVSDKTSAQQEETMEERERSVQRGSRPWRVQANTAGPWRVSLFALESFV